MAKLSSWRTAYVLWVEVFVLINLAFLSLDIFLAHSENDFRYRAEWIRDGVLLRVNSAARTAPYCGNHRHSSNQYAK